ncbi:MAG: SRPBCC family protein [Jeotgalicoccus sp.]
MELQLYFYHHEISMSPEVVFSTINNDEKLLNTIEKLTDIEYINSTSNSREAGTRGILQYNGDAVEAEIVQYSSDRRIEVEIEIPAGRLVTMFNIVPVEDRSEVTISTKLLTDSPVSFALYALKIPAVKKQFNKNMDRLEHN